MKNLEMQVSSSRNEASPSCDYFDLPRVRVNVVLDHAWSRKHVVCGVPVQNTPGASLSHVAIDVLQKMLTAGERGVPVRDVPAYVLVDLELLDLNFVCRGPSKARVVVLTDEVKLISVGSEGAH